MNAIANIAAPVAPATVSEEIKNKAQRALNEAEAGAKRIKSAKALFTYVLCQCANVELHLIKSDASGAKVLDEYAYLSDLMDADIFDAIARDGEGRNRYGQFIIDEIIRATAGFDKPTTAQRDCVKAALPVAFHLLQRTTADKIELTKNGALRAPYAAIHAAPKVDASDAAKEEYEARKNGTYTIDGSNEQHSFNHLARNVVPPKPRQQSQEPKVHDATLLGVLKVMAKGDSHKLDLALWFASLSTKDVFQAIAEYAAQHKDRDNT